MKNESTESEEEKKDCYKCIINSCADKAMTSICGKKIEYTDFTFTSIDHAYYCIKNGGRLLPCYDCMVEVTNTLESVF